MFLIPEMAADRTKCRSTKNHQLKWVHFLTVVRRRLQNGHTAGLGLSQALCSFIVDYIISAAPSTLIAN